MFPLNVELHAKFTIYFEPKKTKHITLKSTPWSIVRLSSLNPFKSQPLEPPEVWKREGEVRQIASRQTGSLASRSTFFCCWKKRHGKRYQVDASERNPKMLHQFIYMVHMIPLCTSSYMVNMIPLSTGLKIHLQVVPDCWESTLWVIGYRKARSLRTWKSFQKSKLL